VHPGEVDRVVKRIGRAFRAGEPWEDTFRLRSRTGEFRWFLSRAVPIRDEAGRVVRWFGTNTDISEHREAQIERERLFALEQKARAEAERAVRLRDEVLAIVAHDLRNAVHTVGMAASSLIKMPQGDEQRIRALEIIKRAASGMDFLISDLLDVARIESGTFPIEPVTVDLPALLEETLDLFEQQARPREITLVCEGLPGIGAVLADRGRLGQVLSNLLSNAIKFTPDHGRVVLRARRLGGEVQVSVEDTGPGIAADSLPHVFDRFWRADRRSRSGTGLGLPIAKSIVEAHGGRIWVESTPGRGSTFHFTLPLPS
jgi:signal transduction histidine kinase